MGMRTSLLLLSRAKRGTPINDKNQSEISIRRRRQDEDDDDTIMKHHTIHEMPETYDRENVTLKKKIPFEDRIAFRVNIAISSEYLSNIHIWSNLIDPYAILIVLTSYIFDHFRENVTELQEIP